MRTHIFGKSFLNPSSKAKVTVNIFSNKKMLYPLTTIKVACMSSFWSDWYFRVFDIPRVFRSLGFHPLSCSHPRLQGWCIFQCWIQGGRVHADTHATDYAKQCYLQCFLVPQTGKIEFSSLFYHLVTSSATPMMKQTIGKIRGEAEL